jgi:hypothetical protein
MLTMGQKRDVDDGTEAGREASPPNQSITSVTPVTHPSLIVDPSMSPAKTTFNVIALNFHRRSVRDSGACLSIKKTSPPYAESTKSATLACRMSFITR